MQVAKLFVSYWSVGALRTVTRRVDCNVRMYSRGLSGHQRMLTQVTLDEVHTLHAGGTLISKDQQTQSFWIQQPHMLAYHKDDSSLITSIRINGDNVYSVEAQKDPSRLVNLRSTALDVHDRRIYVSPTNFRARGLTFSLCKKHYAHTAEKRGKIRVAMMWSALDDGLDLGVYTAVEFTGDRGNNFLILEPDGEANPEEIQRPLSIGTGVVVDGVAFRSKHEGRFAILLGRLGIPYETERSNPTVATNDGGKYVVDFKIYPDDPDNVAFVELKPFFPTREEVEKAVTLHRKTNIDVFIVWGEMCQGLGAHSDKYGSDGRIRPDHSYDRGLRAMKIHTDVQGYVKKDEGYYLMANNTAKGERWEEVTTDDETDRTEVNPSVVHVAHVALKLDNGMFIFDRQEMKELRMLGRIQKSTRVRSQRTGKTYRATDGFKAHLYKDEYLDGRADPGVPDPSDWNSFEVREAFKAARSHRF